MDKYTPEEIINITQNKAHDMADKYCDLVEYGRWPDYDDSPEFYDPEPRRGSEKSTRLSINSILDSQRRVMQEYPSEVKDLRGVDRDWHNGFNCGCLAAFRYIEECLLGTSPEKDKDGKTIWIDSFESADRKFPETWT